MMQGHNALPAMWSCQRSRTCAHLVFLQGTAASVQWQHAPCQISALQGSDSGRQQALHAPLNPALPPSLLCPCNAVCIVSS